MAKANLRILYAEGDEDILKTQAAAIELSGHTVHPAVGRKAVQEALNNALNNAPNKQDVQNKPAFDLVILGPTLTRNDRHHLPYMVKKANPQTTVLVLHADGTRHPYVDACTDTGASLETVLARIDSLRPTGTKAAAAAAGRN